LSDKRISNIRKYDDHDRSKKSDLVFVYKKADVSIEVKSLQTKTIRREGNIFFGKVQCDASDKRPIKLPNGTVVSTTCLLAGEFDLLAANLYGFENKWNFIFAKNSDLPRTNSKKYTPAQRKHLIATSIDVSWPPKPPFVVDPFPLLDEIVKTKQAKK